VGHHRQTRDREIRPRGEAEETGLRCKLDGMTQQFLKEFLVGRKY
jgi:hypothetical protein